MVVITPLSPLCSPPFYVRSFLVSVHTDLRTDCAAEAAAVVVASAVVVVPLVIASPAAYFGK